MNVAPSSSFEVVAAGFATGLTGTIGVRIIDNAGATTTARVTAGIAEYPAGSGIYAKTLTAPAVAGQYTILWDNGATTPGNVAAEDLVVTSSPTYTAPTGTTYITVADLKAELGITVTTYDTVLARNVESASRGVDGACDRRFWLDTVDVTRLYTPNPGSNALPLDDGLVTVTSLKTDTDGDQTFSTTLARNLDYFLEPINAAVDNPAKPYTRVKLNTHRGWPTGFQSVQIVGRFGYPAIPSDVASATMILAQILHKRKDAPFGIVVAGVDEPTAMRIAQTDPTIRGLLNPFMRLGAG